MPTHHKAAKTAAAAALALIAGATMAAAARVCSAGVPVDDQ